MQMSVFCIANNSEYIYLSSEWETLHVLLQINLWMPCRDCDIWFWLWQVKLSRNLTSDRCISWRIYNTVQACSNANDLHQHVQNPANWQSLSRQESLNGDQVSKHWAWRNNVVCLQWWIIEPVQWFCPISLLGPTHSEKYQLRTGFRLSSCPISFLGPTYSVKYQFRTGFRFIRYCIISVLSCYRHTAGAQLTYL